MKLKDNIINEYEQAFPEEKEFTDWVNCIDYEYDEKDNVPALTVTDKVSFKYNTEEYSPYATVNS
jgi:hypothetical protein